MEYRTIITLDIDHAVPGVIEQIEMLYNYRCFIYSTHKHTAENPRLRLPHLPLYDVLLSAAHRPLGGIPPVLIP